MTTETKIDPMEVMLRMMEQNTRLLNRIEELEARTVVIPGTNGAGNGGTARPPREAKPVIDIVTGKYYHAESAAGKAVALAEGINMMTKDGKLNNRIYYSIPQYAVRFVAYTGTPLDKKDDGKVVQEPRALPVDTTTTTKVTTPAPAGALAVTPPATAVVNTGADSLPLMDAMKEADAKMKAEADKKASQVTQHNTQSGRRN